MGIATSDPYEYVEEAGSTRLRVGGTRLFCGSHSRCSTPDYCADAVERV